ncbi:hypothetical protein A2U01_0092711, partial [Trifolium medium]|nr:hypothetical protein [Trifolium medium]
SEASEAFRGSGAVKPLKLSELLMFADSEGLRGSEV